MLLCKRWESREFSMSVKGEIKLPSKLEKKSYLLCGESVEFGHKRQHMPSYREKILLFLWSRGYFLHMGGGGGVGVNSYYCSLFYQNHS